MCRLFGMSAGAEPVKAIFWLLDAPDSLATQSHQNPDGTGIGFFDAHGAPHVEKVRPTPSALRADHARDRSARRRYRGRHPRRCIVGRREPILSINFVLITAGELWALRYPEHHSLLVLQRSAGGNRQDSDDALEQRSSHGTRIHSDGARERPTVVVASERRTTTRAGASSPAAS